MEKLTLGEKIIKASFDLSVRLIERCSDMSNLEEKVGVLRQLPDGTLGKDIAYCLDSRGLRLVPNYESHDLKHVLLNYEMTPLDEIRMQAFMLGNGNYTVPCFTILLFGMLLLPGKWNILFGDYKKGRNAKPISKWTIEKYAAFKTRDLKASITENSPQPVFSIEKFTKMGAFAAIAAGVFGMCFCLPYLFSSSIEDLVGAGFPFVGGSVLTIGGLLVLSNLSKTGMQLESKRVNG